MSGKIKVIKKTGTTAKSFPDVMTNFLQGSIYAVIL